MTDIPKKIYKYMPWNDYTLKNLRNHQIYFSSPADFNDPFDCMINIKFQSLEENKIKVLLDYFQEVYGLDHFKKQVHDLGDNLYEYYQKLDDDEKAKLFNTIEKIAYEINQKIMIDLFDKRGICCFSESGDDILMWSQYADSHKGVCVEFDTSKDKIFSKLYKVTYSDKIPEYSFGITDKGGIDLRENFLISIASKFLCWQYEKEWRVVHEEKNMPYGVNPECISGIYFGLRMEQEFTEAIYWITKPYGPNIKFFQMERSDDKYELIPAELSIKK